MMSKAPVPVVRREMKLPVWMFLFSRTISSWLGGVLVSIDISGLLRDQSSRRGPLPCARGGNSTESGEARVVEDLASGCESHQRMGDHVDDHQVEDRREPEGEGKASHVADRDQV